MTTTTEKHAKTPPMVGGREPVIGHARKFMSDPVNFLTDCYREYGDIFRLRLGNREHVVMLGPEYNKFFFAQTDKLLSIREGYPFFLKMFSHDFYFFAPHEDYMMQREIVMPRFKGNAMRSYVSLMAQETEDLAEQLGDSGEFDLIPTLGPLVMNIAAHAFLGSDFRGKLDDGFFNDFRDFSGGMEVIWPLWLPLSHLRKSRAARKKLNKILSKWVDYRIENPMDPPDFFQDLIGAELSNGEPLSRELIINIILLLVWAGHETTAGQISWSLIDLLQHPDYLNTVCAQTASILGERQTAEMDWEDARALTNIEVAVKESERLHPVAYILMRKAQETLEVEGYRIPKGTYLFAAPSVSHRMADVFPDPHAYKPARFAPGTGEGTSELNRLIGFGGGLHRCAGVNFARLEMKIILTMLARRYDMELIDAPRPVSGTTTHWPAQPCRVRYTTRSASDQAQDGEHAAATESLRTTSSPTSAMDPFTIDDKQDDGESSGCPFHNRQ
ncbi:MAG TPA: cytochrome P450 [Candidatus Hydrogenedentes bacterium]|nr:cytochrome P450 [Candidatus Hydrogenedentota bacterium]